MANRITNNAILNLMMKAAILCHIIYRKLGAKVVNDTDLQPLMLGYTYYLSYK